MTKNSEDLIESLNTAYRLKEQAEAERRKSEMLLSGIRALLEAKSQKDMYQRMFDVLGDFIPHQEALVLEQHAPGLMRCSTSTVKALEDTQWLVDPVFKRAILGKPCAVYSIARQPAWKEHIHLLQPPMTSALYCPFSGPEIEAILVFCHSEKGFYVQNHIHMADRYRDFTQQTLLSVNAKLQALESQQLKVDKKRSDEVLMQSEKMVSLGLLAAGVAHEINNPIGYVTSNFNYLSENIKTFKHLNKHFRSLIENIRFSNDPLVQNSIKVANDWLDNSYVSDTLLDFEELVGDCQHGLHRVKEIIGGLQNFARIDDDNIIPVNINECIRSTLKLVSNELKYHCEIHTELGQIQEIQANEGKINQVLTNLLVNAGHAIFEKGDITITSGVNEHVELGKCTWFSVEDNGCGIKRDNLTRIFEPFYTSKDIGKGTGLGLAISYSIIDKLGGKLEVESELNKGTKFTAYIPCK